MDLARILPESTVLDGFDVSADQYPIPENRPANVTLSVWDCIQGQVPPQLEGAYDIVHLRLFVGVVSNCDPTPLLQNALKMLSMDFF